MHHPFFLQHLKVQSKQLTAKKGANALWLSDKDVTTTNISKSEFGLWAEKKLYALIKTRLKNPFHNI